MTLKIPIKTLSSSLKAGMIEAATALFTRLISENFLEPSGANSLI